MVLYLRQEGRGIGLLNKLRAYGLQDEGLDTVDANVALGFRDDERDYSIAAHMLELLHVRSIRLMTNNPRKLDGLRELGINVSGRIAALIPANEHNRSYLETKALRSGHLIDVEGREHLLEQIDRPIVEGMDADAIEAIERCDARRGGSSGMTDERPTRRPHHRRDGRPGPRAGGRPGRRRLRPRALRLERRSSRRAPDELGLAPGRIRRRRRRPARGRRRDRRHRRRSTSASAGSMRWPTWWVAGPVARTSVARRDDPYDSMIDQHLWSTAERHARRWSRAWSRPASAASWRCHRPWPRAPDAGMSAYAVGKAAQETLLAALAQEVAGHGRDRQRRAGPGHRHDAGSGEAGSRQGPRHHAGGDLGRHPLPLQRRGPRRQRPAHRPAQRHLGRTSSARWPHPSVDRA